MTDRHGERRSARARRDADPDRRGRLVSRLVYGVCGLAFLIYVGPLIVDRAVGAMRQSGECRLLQVVNGDTFRLSCPVIGRQTAQLLGADTPATRGVGCTEEWVAGMRAKWAARRILWSAGEIDAEIDGFGWADRTLVILRADGAGLASQLVEAGHARSDSGYSDEGWCVALGAEFE